MTKCLGDLVLYQKDVHDCLIVIQKQVNLIANQMARFITNQPIKKQISKCPYMILISYLHENVQFYLTVCRSYLETDIKTLWVIHNNSTSPTNLFTYHKATWLGRTMMGMGGGGGGVTHNGIIGENGTFPLLVGMGVYPLLL